MLVPTAELSPTDEDVLKQCGYKLVKAEDITGINALKTAGMLMELTCLGELLECVM